MHADGGHFVWAEQQRFVCLGGHREQQDCEMTSVNSKHSGIPKGTGGGVCFVLLSKQEQVQNPDHNLKNVVHAFLYWEQIMTM